MRLDCEIGRGPECIDKEKALADRVSRVSGLIVRREPFKASRYDAKMLMEEDWRVAIAEIKCRNMTMTDLRRHGSLILTHDKMMDCVDTAYRYGVMFGVFAGLTCGSIVYWFVSDEAGRVLFPYKVATTRTRRSVNGGTAMRENAYLPVAHMQILCNPPCVPAAAR